MAIFYHRIRLIDKRIHRCIKNESKKLIYVSAEDGAEWMIVNPGQERVLPESIAGETLIEIEIESSVECVLRRVSR